MEYIPLGPDTESARTYAKNLYLPKNDFSLNVFKSLPEEFVTTEIENAIYLYDTNLIISGWNSAAERLYGYRAKEIVGKHISLLCPTDSAEDTQSIHQQIMLGKTIYGWQTIRKTKSGKLIRINLQICPLFNIDGDVIGASAIAKYSFEEITPQDKYYRLAYYDQLTGLPNRTLFQTLLKNELKVAKQKQSQCAIMFVDIDNFKDVNDLLGHDVGDELLHAIASRLQGCIRKKDIVARQGGDEFTLILPEIKGERSPRVVAQRIINQIAKPLRLQKHDVHVTASIGISMHPLNGENMKDLLMYADSAMYVAKRSGGNRFAFYSPKQLSTTLKSFSFENKLSKAIDNHELSIAYQAQLDLKEKKISSVETLLRWNNPKLGSVAPAKFIPVAEKLGIMHEICTWTLDEVFAQIPPLYMQGIHVSMNISIHQLNADFITLLKQMMKKYAIEKHILEFEILEAENVTDISCTKKALEEVKKLGITLCIDNFGMGYSSIRYLYLLPISRIKIDKSFIKHIADCANNQKIVRAILAMAHELGVQVIAQGVETKEELDSVEKLGCDYAQGYFIDEPQSISKLLKR